MREHSQYLLSLYRAGELKLAVSLAMATAVPMFFAAADDAAALALVQADPAVSSGLLSSSYAPGGLRIGRSATRLGRSRASCIRMSGYGFMLQVARRRGVDPIESCPVEGTRLAALRGHRANGAGSSAGAAAGSALLATLVLPARAVAGEVLSSGDQTHRQYRRRHHEGDCVNPELQTFGQGIRLAIPLDTAPHLRTPGRPRPSRRSLSPASPGRTDRSDAG